jgi:hypothetical protein
VGGDGGRRGLWVASVWIQRAGRRPVEGWWLRCGLRPSNGRLRVRPSEALEEQGRSERLSRACGNDVSGAFAVGSAGHSSRFTRGVDQLAVEARTAGSVVELVDGERFLDALDLTTRSAPPNLCQVLDLAQPEVPIVSRTILI